MRGEHRAFGDQPPHLGLHLAMMHGAILIHIPGRRRRTAVPLRPSRRGRTACAETAARCSSRRAVSPSRNAPWVLTASISSGAGLGANDRVDQGQRLIRMVREQRADVAGGAAVADQRRSHRRPTTAASSDVRKTPPAGCCDQNPWRADRAPTKSIGVTGRQLRRAGRRRRRILQPQPPQLQRRRETQRAIDRGACRRRVEPGGEAAAGPPRRGRHRPVCVARPRRRQRAVTSTMLIQALPDA